MAWCVGYGAELKSGDLIMTDPIADDPQLMWTWTRIVIALVAMLAFVIGFGPVDFDVPSQ